MINICLKIENNNKNRNKSDDKTNDQINGIFNRFFTSYSRTNCNYLNRALNNKKKSLSIKESNNSKNITHLNEEFYHNQINKLKDNIEKLDEDKNFIEDLLEQKNIELSNMNKYIEQFKNKIHELNRIKKNLEIKLNKANNEINYYKKIEEENEERINSLNSREFELLDKEKKIENKSIMVNNKELDIIKREEEIKNKNEIINKKQFEIIQKEKKLEEKELEDKKIRIINSNKSESLKKEKFQIMQKEKELNDRDLEIIKKEKDFNNKFNFLEDKENFLKIERQELEKKKKELQNNYEINIIDKKISKLLVSLKEQEDLIINKEEAKKKLKEILLNEPLLFYSSPTLIGLKNVKNISFMNSILQCLSQTKSLTNYFLNVKNRNIIINNSISLQNKNNFQLSPLYLELINNLWLNNESKSYSPYEFKNKIEEINPLFKDSKENNVKDFIICILETLYKELKYSIKSSFNHNYNCNEPYNEYEQNKVFNHFYREFLNEYSIISDIFFGIYETTNICLNCKKNYNSKGLNNPIIYNYEIFNSIIFYLEEIKRYYQINKDISLNDCFSYIQKDELLNEENQLKCKICKQKCDFIYNSKIYKSPNVLIIILERGKENNVNLKFSEILDITNFVSQKDEIKIIYNLYAVITYININKINKYYIASCKNPINNEWYKYNDEKVTPINNIQKEIIDFETPLVLFYTKN